MQLLEQLKMRNGWVGHKIMALLKNYKTHALATDEIFLFIQRETSGYTDVIVYSYNEIVTALKSLRNCGDVRQFYINGKSHWAYHDRTNNDEQPVREYYR